MFFTCLVYRRFIHGGFQQALSHRCHGLIEPLEVGFTFFLVLSLDLHDLLPLLIRELYILRTSEHGMV